MNGTMQYNYNDAAIAMHKLKENVENINAYVNNIQKMFYKIYPSQWNGKKADSYEQKIKELMEEVRKYAESIEDFRKTKIKDKIASVQRTEEEYAKEASHLA